MNANLTMILGALVLIGLGIFFIQRFGSAHYQMGYDQCVIDRKAVIAKTAKELEQQRGQDIPNDGVMLKLRANGWLRPDADQ